MRAEAGSVLAHVDVIRRGDGGATRFHFVLVAIRCDCVSGTPLGADDVVEARRFDPAAVVAGILPESRHVDTIVQLATDAERTDGGLLLDLD